MERFDPKATPAAVDEQWAKRYTTFLVRDTPLFNNTIHQHLNMLRNLVAHAGLPARHTYGARLAKMKVDPLTMRDLLGHGNLSSTMVYVHLEADETERAVLDGF